MYTYCETCGQVDCCVHVNSDVYSGNCMSDCVRCGQEDCQCIVFYDGVKRPYWSVRCDMCGMWECVPNCPARDDF